MELTGKSGVGAEVAPISGARYRPIIGWAFVGSLFILLDIYVFGSWILSDKFTPTLPGDSPTPWWTEMWGLIHQVMGPLFLCWAIFYIVRGYIKNSVMPSMAVFMLAWQTSYWQDPLVNYIRPMFSYSSNMVNFGSWSEFIPGWVSPNGSNMPEPLLFMSSMYMIGIVGVCYIALLAMRVAKRRFPGINNVQLVLVACTAAFLFDLMLEFGWVRMGLYSYLGTIKEGTLFYGKIYQMPVYNFVFWGACTGLCASLFYFKDDKGYMMVEKGAETFRNKAGQSVMRVLAVAGFINVMYLSYSMIMILSVLWIDPYPESTPTWLRNELCGEGTDYECPAYDVHIPLKDSGPLPPYKDRL